VYFRTDKINAVDKRGFSDEIKSEMLILSDNSEITCTYDQ
jgi:hypothetical protein